jgi:hypothetical protein
MTQVVNEPSSNRVNAQCVIAVFDDWESLYAVLDEFAPEETRGGTTVLYSPRARPPPTASPQLFKEVVDLHFAPAGQRICCTRGEVALGLGERVAKGARSLGDALRSWLRTDQAWQLESHVEKGHFVLWVQPSTTEQFGALCGRLVRASRHLVGVCNMNVQYQPGRFSK